jgi:hypothetical protein
MCSIHALKTSIDDWGVKQSQFHEACQTLRTNLLQSLTWLFRNHTTLKRIDFRIVKGDKEEEADSHQIHDLKTKPDSLLDARETKTCRSILLLGAKFLEQTEGQESQDGRQTRIQIRKVGANIFFMGPDELDEDIAQCECCQKFGQIYV